MVRDGWNKRSAEPGEKENKKGGGKIKKSLEASDGPDFSLF